MSRRSALIANYWKNSKLDGYGGLQVLADRLERRLKNSRGGFNESTRRATLRPGLMHPLEKVVGVDRKLTENAWRNCSSSSGVILTLFHIPKGFNFAAQPHFFITFYGSSLEFFFVLLAP